MMIFLFCFLIIVVLGYSFLLFWYYMGFLARIKKEIGVNNHEKNLATYTILSCFKNDLDAVNQLVDKIQVSLLAFKNYVFVNNNSEENHFFDSICQKIKEKGFSINHYLLHPEKNTKKEAIDLGVRQAETDYIYVTDVDVQLNLDAMRNVLDFASKSNGYFIAGIHRYIVRKDFLSIFLSIEQDILTLISIGSLAQKYPTMCNGANMCFKKEAFLKVNGYQGLFHTNGGDDMFLFHRIFKQFPEHVFYCTDVDAAVYSEPPNTVKSMIKQRLRWLSKSNSYELKHVSIQMALILLGNIAYVSSFLLGFFSPIFFIFFIIKWVVDMWFAKVALNYFKSTIPMHLVFFSSFLYPFYILFLSILMPLNQIYNLRK